MPRPCSFCIHERRQELEASILTGKLTQRQVAKMIGRSEVAIGKHMANHVPSALQTAQHYIRGSLPPNKLKVLQEVELSAGLDVYEGLVEINHTTNDILTNVLAEDDNRLALKAIERIEKQLELQARLQGMFKDSPQTQVNILLTNEWQKLKRVILTTLEGFPEAKEAIATALTEARSQ